MRTGEDAYPKSENIGKDCLFWCLGGLASGCCFPKAELQGRRSCEGIVDDICLYVKDGIKPNSLSDDEIIEIKLRAPNLIDKSYLPPGDTT